MYAGTHWTYSGLLSTCQLAEARGDRQAIEIYQQAANQYKMAKMWQEAQRNILELSLVWDSVRRPFNSHVERGKYGVM